MDRSLLPPGIAIPLPTELYNPDGTISDKTMQLVNAHMNMFPAKPCCRSDNRELEIDSRIMVAAYSSGTVKRNGKTALLVNGKCYRPFVTLYCTNCGLTWFYDLNSVIGGIS